MTPTHTHTLHTHTPHTLHTHTHSTHTHSTHTLYIHSTHTHSTHTSHTHHTHTHSTHTPHTHSAHTLYIHTCTLHIHTLHTHSTDPYAPPTLISSTDNIRRCDHLHQTHTHTREHASTGASVLLPATTRAGPIETHPVSALVQVCSGCSSSHRGAARTAQTENGVSACIEKKTVLVNYQFRD